MHHPKASRLARAHYGDNITGHKTVSEWWLMKGTVSYVQQGKGKFVVVANAEEHCIVCEPFTPEH